MQDAEREWQDRESASLLANSWLIDDDESGNEEEHRLLLGKWREKQRKRKKREEVKTKVEQAILANLF